MRKRFCKIWKKPYTEKRLSHYGSIEGEQPEIVKADGGRPAGWLKAERYIEKEVDMVSFNKVTRVIAGIAATALLIPMAACGGGSSSGGSAAPADIPAAGTDDGTEITLWTRSPLERQAKNAVKAYNASHKNQVKLEIIPNDDMEGKVGGASQTDSLRTFSPVTWCVFRTGLLKASSPTSPSRSTDSTTSPTCSRATLKPVPWMARNTRCRSSPTFP